MVPRNTVLWITKWKWPVDYLSDVCTIGKKMSTNYSTYLVQKTVFCVATVCHDATSGEGSRYPLPHSLTHPPTHSLPLLTFTIITPSIYRYCNRMGYVLPHRAIEERQLYYRGTVLLGDTRVETCTRIRTAHDTLLSEGKYIITRSTPIKIECPINI